MKKNTFKNSLEKPARVTFYSALFTLGTLTIFYFPRKQAS